MNDVLKKIFDLKKVAKTTGKRYTSVETMIADFATDEFLRYYNETHKMPDIDLSLLRPALQDHEGPDN
jgi:hypothetical protein